MMTGARKLHDKLRLCGTATPDQPIVPWSNATRKHDAPLGVIGGTTHVRCTTHDVVSTQ